MSLRHMDWFRPVSGTFRVLAMALVAAGCAHAQRPFDSQLAPLVAKLPDPAAVAGVCVIDLQSGAPVFQYNADTALVPASTMKMFVMAAGVDVLGTGFQFDTVLATDGTNLIVLGDGDPGFGDEKIHRARGQAMTADFDRWAETLKQRGLHRLSGDLILDETVFDDLRIHPSWDRADHGKWYAAPVGGLNINDNCLDITVSPAKAGEACAVSVQPPNALAKFANQCRSGGKGEPVVHYAGKGFEYALSGRTARPYTLGAVAFPDSGLLFGDSLRIVLARNGVQLGGHVRRQRVRLPGGALPLGVSVVDHRRTALAEVLGRIGKDSQNLFAECLIKRTGFEWAKKHGEVQPQGSWTTGAAAVTETLRRANINPAGFVVADGSGLSRDNRCTARQLASIAAWMHRHPQNELFRDSLSEAGSDGSMKKRLRDLRGHVFCKTGTIRGVRTLAGLVQSEDGRWYSFAAMFNGYKGSSAPYKEIQDKICRVLSGAAAQPTAAVSPHRNSKR